jgi:cardiolipin synthase
VNLNLPNLLSLLRMGLIPLFVIALLRGEAVKALAIFVVAGLSDALDGFLARVLDQRSLLGAYLDPIADKLLLTTAYIGLTALEGETGLVAIPMWVTVLIIARDVLILVVALALALALDVAEFPPTPLSKLTTVFQIAGVILVLLSGPCDWVDRPAQVSLYVVGALTVASGVDYIYRANRMVGAAE